MQVEQASKFRAESGERRWQLEITSQVSDEFALLQTESISFEEGSSEIRVLNVSAENVVYDRFYLRYQSTERKPLRADITTDTLKEAIG